MSRVKLEDHHPELMKYSAETRRVLNAYNSGGWDAVEIEVQDIITEAYTRGQLNERSAY